MSLNKYMHPRNRYKISKPSFLHLALKYPEFRAHITQDDSGKVLLDFKNADALRALTKYSLKEDFDLTVNLPSDRLVPTLPLRLNYIHWLEDIVGTEAGKWGIDIGTGASCIYPLLATKMNGWNFLATESDPENAYHAKKNVDANDFSDSIHVMQVSNEDALIGPLEKFTASQKFEFCMCNPPFFADHMEAQAIETSRSIDRPDAGSVSTASPQECIAQGGEVGFIRQMVEESTVLRDKIRVYSSMLGKKASLGQLKEELRHQKVPKFASTEFCQGKTMRWGIAWTYDESVSFPRSQFEGRKEKPPLQFFVPKGAAQVQYNVHSIASFLKDLLRSMKIHCYQGKTAKSYTSITLTAVENTWCHQRRLRRQQQRSKAKESDQSNVEVGVADEIKNDVKGKKEENCTSSNSASFESPQKGTEADKDNSNLSGAEADDSNLKKRPGSDIAETLEIKRQRLDNDNEVESSCVSSSLGGDGEESGSDAAHKKSDVDSGASLSKDGLSEMPESDSSPKEFVLKCVMRLKRMDEQISLELEWLDGQSRELLHQVKTFLQNKLKVEKEVTKK